MIEKRLNILLVEDTKTDEALIKRHLSKAIPNALITVARNKTEFLEKIEWLMPDIVLSDFNLPDINGLDILLNVKEKFPFVSFVFVTGALNNEEKVAHSILQGASGYVLKENLKQLPEKLMEVIQKAELRQQAAAEEERRWRDAGISLQQATELLNKAPDFDKKEKILSLISEALASIQE